MFQELDLSQSSDDGEKTRALLDPILVASIIVSLGTSSCTANKKVLILGMNKTLFSLQHPDYLCCPSSLLSNP